MVGDKDKKIMGTEMLDQQWEGDGEAEVEVSQMEK